MARPFIGLPLALLALLASARASDAPILHPDPEPFELAGDFRAPGRDGDGRGNVANDVSGLACAETASGKRRCLLIDDESGKAQFLTIEGRRIEPKGRVDLIGKAPSPQTRGTVPAPGCPKPAPRFREMDGEGVAYAAPYFYVTGSHGCGRRSQAFTLSAMVLARIRVDARGKPDGDEAVETTWRLGDALARAGTVGPHVLKDLTAENGLNVEGLAVIGGDLYVGLRAPSLGGSAFLVAVPVEALFADGPAPYAGTPRTIPVRVGEGAGIRDMTPLADGSLLLLTGPAQFQDVPYRLFRFDPRTGANPVPLGELAPLSEAERSGKPEAVALLGGDRVLVFFDSLPNGGPRSYAVPGLSGGKP